jgi:7-carboxy-7-deazaguanine synthase
MLRVSEMFTSSQGEGRLAGMPSVFIRLSGCNLRCWFCDTPYASWHPEGQRVSVESLLKESLQARLEGGVTHVVITGGEPLLQRGIERLSELLRENGFHITIETAGTVFREVACDLMSISPKLQSSGPSLPMLAAERVDPAWAQRHESRRWQPETIHQLIRLAPAFQLKFVVDRPEELDEVQDAVESLAIPPEHVWLMPQARSIQELDHQHTWLIGACEARGFHLCDRWQLRWYGNRRGT